MAKDSGSNFLLVIAVLAVAVSLAGMIVTYGSINNFKQTWVTGFASSNSNATVNITINALTAINFTTSIINFGTGAISGGFPHANLSTAAGTVIGGTWTPVSNGFVLENIGNTNVTIDLYTGKNSTQFFGGTLPIYRYNVTDLETGACRNNSVFIKGTLYNTNNTNPGNRICESFPPESFNDTLRIDIFLSIPSDSITGTLGDTVTAIATSIN